MWRTGEDREDDGMREIELPDRTRSKSDVDVQAILGLEPMVKLNAGAAEGPPLLPTGRTDEPRRRVNE